MNNKEIYMHNKSNKSIGAKINFSNLINTRDLGGYVTTENKTIKYKKLIRSGDLYPASKEDIQILKNNYNLKLIIDFRSPSEAFKKPDPIIDNSVDLLIPIFFDYKINTFNQIKQKECILKKIFNYIKLLREDPQNIYLNLYTKMVVDPLANRSYTLFFDKLANYPIENNESILWHCSYGKDRTGLGTALLLFTLGVDEETIIYDYMKTNIFIKNTIDTITNEVIKITDDVSIAKKIEALFYVQEEYILRALNMMKKMSGSIDNYLYEILNITDEKRKEIKNRFLTS